MVKLPKNILSMKLERTLTVKQETRTRMFSDEFMKKYILLQVPEDIADEFLTNLDSSISISDKLYITYEELEELEFNGYDVDPIIYVP